MRRHRGESCVQRMSVCACLKHIAKHKKALKFITPISLCLINFFSMQKFNFANRRRAELFLKLFMFCSSVAEGGIGKAFN